MEKRTYDIRGMHCAACAAKVERAVKKIAGVSDVNVMLLKNSLSLIADESVVPYGIVEEAVKNAGYEAVVSDGSHRIQNADDSEVRKEKKQLLLSVVLTLMVALLSMGPDFGLVIFESPLNSGVGQLILTATVMWLQRKYFISAFNALKHLGCNMDTLVSMGSSVSFFYSMWVLNHVTDEMPLSVLHHEYPLFFESAAAIVTFVAIGKYFEQKAKVKTTDAVMKLYDLAPKFVRQKDGEQEKNIPLAAVKQGDILILKAGDQIGVDGTVIKGQGHVNESVLTGESAPCKKEVGSKILSSGVVLDGYLEFEATAVGAETTLSKIIALVDEASSKKAPIARLADRIASVFVPAVITLAALTFLIWYFLIGAELTEAVNFSVSILVVSCPCALGLATPVAIMAGTGRAAGLGVLFKSPEIIEVMSRADTFVFDKTGTLTYGRMHAGEIVSCDGTPNSMIMLFAASLESHSDHPLARAIVESAGGIKPFPVENYRFEKGRGVMGTIGGTLYALGNERLVQDLGAALTEDQQEKISLWHSQGQDALILLKEKTVSALIAVGDEIKKDAKALIDNLKARQVRTLMLTGDHLEVAKYTARRLGISASEVSAGLMPEDKDLKIKDLQKEGRCVVMVGDGINDSVSLTRADVGVGLAGTSDIALSSCDVVLLHESLADVAKAWTLAKLIVRNIKENLFWAFIYNVIFIPVAAGVFYYPFGWHLNPGLGAMLMGCSSVCVCLNALRLGFVKIESINSESEDGEKVIMQKTLKIEGMHCEHCVAAVNKALSALPGAGEVKVSLDEKQATLSVPDMISDDMLKSAVESCGFKVEDIK